MNYHSELVDPLFWGKFSTEVWEKKPYAVQSVFTEPPIVPDKLFATVYACTKNYDARIGLRMYVGGEPQQIWPGHPLLPAETDRTFDGYHARMTSTLNGKFYCLVLNFPELRDFDLWDWSRNFLYDLYKEIGFNKLGTYNALFIGDYDRTPFGVHKDPESVFHIPVIGRKAMRIWPNEYKLKQPSIERAQNYRTFVNDSIKIEAGPGGIIYWPSDYWHISEKADRFSVSLALSLNCHRNIMQLLAAKVAAYANASNAFDNKIVVPFNPAAAQSSAVTMPAEIKVAADIFRAVVSEEALQKEWLRLVTASNFMYSPDAGAATDRGMREDAVVSGNRKFPIVYMKQPDGRLCVSANGHLSMYEGSDMIINFIKDINNGTEIEVNSLTNNTHRETIMKLVSWLGSVRAVAIRSLRSTQVVQ